MSVTAILGHNEEQVRQSRRRDLSIDYLRTTLTLMVLAHHSSLAYTTWAHFDNQHIFRSTAPIVDVTRWAFFDYAENFNDVFFMSLMFFVSGLFVYPALRRHGTFGFIRDRFLRLGVPFAFAVVFLMPIAYYASWQLTGRSAGFLDFYKRLAESGFHCRAAVVRLGAAFLRRGAGLDHDAASALDASGRAVYVEAAKSLLGGFRQCLAFSGTCVFAHALPLWVRCLDCSLYVPLRVSGFTHRPLRSMVYRRVSCGSTWLCRGIALPRWRTGTVLASLDVWLHSRL